MKIALSAYHFKYPEIQEVLHSCDLIFTSNVGGRDSLWEIYGKHKVRFIPDTTQETFNWLKSRFPDAEFIDYSYLFNLLNH